jgi:hypothetical protein
MTRHNTRMNPYPVADKPAVHLGRGASTTHLAAAPASDGATPRPSPTRPDHRTVPSGPSGPTATPPDHSAAVERAASRAHHPSIVKLSSRATNRRLVGPLPHCCFVTHEADDVACAFACQERPAAPRSRRLLCRSRRRKRPEGVASGSSPTGHSRSDCPSPRRAVAAPMRPLRAFGSSLGTWIDPVDAAAGRRH